MKKILWFIFGVLSVIGFISMIPNEEEIVPIKEITQENEISEEKVKEPIKENKPIVEKAAEENTEEKPGLEEKPKKEETKPVVQLLKSTLTADEFNAKFKLDAEEEQYPNGKFQLKDGSIVNADSYNYGESELFDYAMAIFSKGKLAHLQIETDATPEELSKGLGMDLSNARVESNMFGYEFIFDETFSDENISVFPEEWE